MTEYTQIIQLRNKGKSQDDISKILGISRRSIIRYLKSGKIPIYNRPNKSCRIDPLKNYYKLVKEKLEENNKLPLNELYEYILEKGYNGSERTLRRKTLELRNKLKSKEIYFQRKVVPSEVMEGDFTEFYIKINKTKRKIYLWVTSLPYSNSYFVTPYYHCSFECFAEGSINAFKEFGGIAEKYRLDNMSPAVSKILQGKNRVVTERFAQFQQHYNFKQDFCNPARGNEKGNVEANNKYIKKKILAKISLNNLSFINIAAFKEFVWKLCREHNNKESVDNKFTEEKLAPLPIVQFKCFRTEVVKINKFSLFSFGKLGNMYSVPSTFIGLSLEIRVYPNKIDILYNCEIIATHNRLYGQQGVVSINIVHIIDGLLKKPGAMKDWKYRDILFERPAWKNFYNKIITNGGKDKDYLKCVKLINKYGKDIVTVAMELVIEGGDELSASNLIKIINNEMENIYNMEPICTNLNQYDDFIKGNIDEHES